MANRRPQGGGGRRDFGYGYGRNDNFGQNNWPPWPGPGMNQPLPGGSFLGPYPPYMPMHHDFSPNVGQYDPNPGQNWMGNQGHFRHSGNFNSSGSGGHKPFKAKGRGQQYNNLSAATSKSKNKFCYDHIDPHFLICHICKEHCATGMDFKAHLSEESHFNNMQIRLKMYSSTVNKMRSIYKIRHMNAPQPTNYNFYCELCDVHAGDEVTHRKTTEHRKLKKYALPSCISCKIKDMSSREEYEEHRFTPDHMWMVQKRVEKMSNSTKKIFRPRKKNKAKKKNKVTKKGKNKI